MDVKCDLVRESYSADIDGEPGALSSEEVSQHLAGCAECTGWVEQVGDLQRMARLAAAPIMVDETERFVSAVRADQHARAVTPRRLLPVRLALAGVGLAQIWLSTPSLLLGRDAAAPAHVAHEIGTFGIALGAGLVLAALRPRLAAGMVAIFGIVAGLLVLTAWIDAVLRYTTLTQEWPHLVEVAGFVLLLRLAYLSNDRDWTPLLVPLRRGAGPGRPIERSAPSQSDQPEPSAPPTRQSGRQRALGA